MLHLDFYEPVSQQPGDADSSRMLRSLLERAVRRADREVAALLTLPDKVTIAAGVDPQRVVPETGVGARAWSDDRIDLWIDPRNPWVEAAGEEEVVAMIAHELHHCARWRRPGYGYTLAEVLVSEGLACHFEATFRGGIAPFWARALDGTQIARLERSIGRALDSRDYDHRAWFGGAAGGERQGERDDAPQDDGAAVPRHSGHSLGWQIAARHLRRTGRNAAQLVHEPAHRFFD